MEAFLPVQVLAGAARAASSPSGVHSQLTSLRRSCTGVLKPSERACKLRAYYISERQPVRQKDRRPALTRRTGLRCNECGGSLDLLERRLVDFVLGDLGRYAPSRQAAELGTAADVAVALLQCLADVLLLDVKGHLAQQLGQRSVQVDVESCLGGVRRQHVRRQVF